MKKEFPSILQFITVCDYTNPYTESMVLDPPVLMMALGHGVPVITCRAAILWKMNAPLSIEEVKVDSPNAGEFWIKIISSGLCGTDMHILEGKNEVQFPVILGHEGAGVVESIGEGVNSVKPGDKVLMFPLPQCRECSSCLHPKGNLCLKENMISPTGLLLDGTSRFTCRGRNIYNLYGTSTFTEYTTVVHEIAVGKIDDATPMDKVCIMSCEVPTGFGAVFNTAKVTPGSTCVVFGLGGIGSAIVIGCKASGASRILPVDINEKKFPRARDCLNPQNLEKPVQEVVKEMTGIGADFAFKATGLIDTMVCGLGAHFGIYGVCVSIGASPTNLKLSFDKMLILSGRTLKGAMMGEYKTRDSIPKMITDYINKNINDPLITPKLPFEKINEALELFKYETGPQGHYHADPPDQYWPACWASNPQALQTSNTQSSWAATPPTHQAATPQVHQAATPQAHQNTTHWHSGCCLPEEGCNTTHCWIQTCLRDADKHD
uniref:LOW QUALITY PROTEIN: alcohol dehydrogenase 6-like n=1 Tax=Castor canadensis TaxID=51338 RepID=A0A8B7TU66_CASCN|nr:LOW QUALITY PROTEIN: alcohol dehydrogenase 6-like [Castor canadensis]